MKKCILAVCIIVATGTSVAQEENSKKVFDQHVWGASVHSMAIDEQVALSSRVGEELTSINFFWQGEINNLLLSAGMGLLTYEDHGGYQVNVTDQYGNSSTKTASASGVDLNFEAGYRHKISKLNLDILAGFSSFNSSRSVDNCSDCPDEDIEIDSGSYIKPRIGYQFGEKWGAELSYTNYFTADVSNNIGLAFTFRN